MSAEEIRQLREEIDKIKDELKSSDESKRAEFIKKYNEFKKKYPGVFIPDDDTTLDCPPGQHYDVKLGKCVPNTPPGCPELPDDGRDQSHKGASRDANTWKVVRMNDDPSLFKIVDNGGINVADQFRTQANAEQYIAHYLCTPPSEECPPGQHRDENGNCVPDVPPPPPGGTGDYPYQAIGEPMQSTTRRAVRHYASGKPDDETVERNVKGIEFKNYQFVIDVIVHEMEHPDTVSLKIGGTHTGSGWFDHGVSVADGQGQCCLGKEEDHPSTDLCVVEGPNIGEILGKRIKIAATYFTDENKTELWTNLGDGWVKQLEGVDVGGFRPDSDEDECQLRIDGFPKGDEELKPPEPEIFSAVVTEIAGDNPPLPPSPPPSPPPAPNPPPSPPPTPPPAGSSTTKDGVIAPVKIKGEWDYEYETDERDGGARYNMNGAGVQLVMIGYFRASDDGDDEVSSKNLGGRHTDSDRMMGCIYDLGAPVGGGRARMRCECPHPDYTGTLNGPQVIKAEVADSIVGEWKGYMTIITQESGKVRIKWFQDVGPNDSAPANNWKLIYEYLDDGNNLDGIDDSIFPITNLDHTKGTAQNTWRIDETPGLEEKWLAIAEF